MGILLSEQIQQTRQLKEISYHAPIFGVHYYEKQSHGVGQKAGKRMFYDFYAMEFLWSFLGSGQIPKAEGEKWAKLPEDDPRRDIISGKFHRFLPSASVKTIDDLYEQVTNAVAKNLINYIRAAVIQEFQYVVKMSHGWTSFRQSLVSTYNAKKTVSKEKFLELVRNNIPEMEPYPDVIMRLLKFSKYFSKIHTMDDKDVYDVVRQNKDEKPGELDFIQPSEEPEGEPATEPLEPDETDYNAPPTKRRFGKYGPENPSPYEQPWSGLSTFKDIEGLPEIPGKEDDEDEDGKAPLKEEYINVDKVQRVYDAMKKAGVTLDDIEKAYNKIPWGGGYGGPRWGDGVISLLKLINAKKNLTTEDMNHIIDHIYDLQHNTGSLLNKGPMFVSETDLNRRYKISDIARFLPHVSPVIKNLILRYQKYLRTSPDDATLEANMDYILNSPNLSIEPELSKKLTDMGFINVGDGSFRVNTHAKNKKGQDISAFEIVSKHDLVKADEKGNFVKIPNTSPIYVVADNYRADVKAFKNIDELVSHLEAIKNTFAPTYGGVSFHNPSIKTAQVDYLNSHNKIKLGPNLEQDLLNINMGWRSSQKYKAYFSDGHRFELWAFSDGTFLAANNNSPDYKVFTNWPAAYAFAKTQTVNADPYPDKVKAQAEIDQAMGKKTVTPSSIPSKKFVFPSSYIPQLNAILSAVSQGSGITYQLVPQKDGSMGVYSNVSSFPFLFSIGNNVGGGFSAYIVSHHLPPNDKESWSFNTIASAMKFVEKNINGLVNSGLSKAVPLSQQPKASITPSAFSSSGQELPSYSSSETAYSVHKGINTPPKHTIRLTKDHEELLKTIGFSPKMVGNDVWYLHKSTGDTAKFFPDDSAKVLFTSKSASMKAPLVNFTPITKALNWLVSKYTVSAVKSPLDTPAQSKSPVSKGVEAGIMFDGLIKAAGFVWDSVSNEYVDQTTSPIATLHIFPDRSSTLKFSDGQEKNFPNLASLVAYLKEDYKAQKKSSPIKTPTLSTTQWPKIKKIEELLNSAGYKYTAVNAKGGFTYNTDDGDSVVLYNDGKSNVYDAKHKNSISFNDQDELITYLQEKHGSTQKHPISIWNTFHKSLDDAGFVETTTGAKGIGYTHTPDHNFPDNTLTFYVYDDNRFLWEIPKIGAMELSFKDKSDLYVFIGQALSKITPMMSANEVQNIFVKTHADPKDEMFDALIEEAAQLNGLQVNPNFSIAMAGKGFEWDDVNNLYSNYELRQLVVITEDNQNNNYIYHVYYVDKNGNGKKEIVEDNELFSSIGNEGSIHKSLRKDVGSKIKSISDPDIDKQISELGFVKKSPDEMPGWYGTEVNQVYLNPKNNTVLYVLKNGKVSNYASTSATKIEDYPNIEEFLKANTSGGYYPFSNENYKTAKGKDAVISRIKLNDQDTNALKAMGFEWEPSHQWYVKNVSNLQEAKKKSKSPKHVAQQFELPMGASEKYEVFNAYNTGNATWWSVKGAVPGSGSASVTDSKPGTIEELLKFIWQKWSGKGNKEPIYHDMENLLMNAGYAYDSATAIANGGYQYTYIDPDNKSKVIVWDGSTGALYITPDGTHSKNFDNYEDLLKFLGPTKGNNPQSQVDYATTYHTFPPHQSIKLQPEDEKKLEAAGYSFLHISNVEIPYQNAYIKGHSRMFFYANGTAKYWPTEKGYVSEFPSIEKAIEFLISEPSGVDDMTPSNFDYKNYGRKLPFATPIGLNGPDMKIMNKLGFTMVNNSYKNLDGEEFTIFSDGSATFSSPKAFKNPAQSFKTVKQALQWAIDHYSTGTYQNPQSSSKPIRVKAIPSVELTLMKSGYKWGEMSKQYVNIKDPVDTIIFVSDGMIYWYTHGSLYEPLTFDNSSQFLEAFYTKYPNITVEIKKSVQKESIYKSLMKTIYC